MIEALRFVQGAVAAKDFRPELTHFSIKFGRITGYNGYMALSSPVDIEFEAYPAAKPFVRAIASCGDVAEIGLTDGGKVRVRSGNLRVLVQCIDAFNFEAVPQGESYHINDHFIEDIKHVSKFMGIDASRPWCMGIGIHNGIYYATNNIAAIQLYHGADLPDMTIPHFAIKELLRYKKKPAFLQTDGFSVTFHYEDGKWLRTQLIEDMFPFEMMDSAFERAATERVELTPDLFEAAERVKAFTDGSRLFLKEGSVCTAQDDSGASYDVDFFVPDACFNVDCFQLMEGAEKVAWGDHVTPTQFWGGAYRGMLLGMRP